MKVIGLITLIMTLIAFAISIAAANLPTKDATTAKRMTTINNIAINIVLGISSLALGTGFTDLRSFSFCILQNIPLEILVGFGTPIAGGVNMFGALMGLKWWLERRIKQEQKNANVLGDEKGRGRLSLERRKQLGISKPIPIPPIPAEDYRAELSRFSDN